MDNFHTLIQCWELLITGRWNVNFKCWYFLRCRFIVITSDGSLQQIEISYGQSGSTFPKYISNHRNHLCNNIFCFDRHHELNLLVAVHKNSGMNLVIFSMIFYVIYSIGSYFSNMLFSRLIDLNSLLLLTTRPVMKETSLCTWQKIKICVEYDFWLLLLLMP